MLADFTIRIHDARKPMAVQVKIHDNVGALRSAMTRYDGKVGNKKENHSNVLGVCHRFHTMYTKKDLEVMEPLCAIVRLAPPNLGTGIVAHELCHAAVHLWEIEHKFEEVPLTCQNDEWFCWILGELVRQTTVKLFEKGIYT